MQVNNYSTNKGKTHIKRKLKTLNSEESRIDFHLSFVLSKASPTISHPPLQQNVCFSLLPCPPALCPSVPWSLPHVQWIPDILPSYLPSHIHCFIPILNASCHFMEIYKPLLPGTKSANCRFLSLPPFSKPVPKSHASSAVYLMLRTLITLYPHSQVTKKILEQHPLPLSSLL